MFQFFEDEVDEIEKEDDPNRVLPGGEREGYPVFHCVTVEGSVVGERSELDESIERKLFRPDQARENLTQECFHCDVASPLDLDQLLQREFGRVRLFQVVPQDTLGLREEPIDRKCVLPTPERGDRIADDPFPADERGKVEPRFDETGDELFEIDAGLIEQLNAGLSVALTGNGGTKMKLKCAN